MQTEIITTEHEQELAKLREQHLRLAADYDNYRKRAARETAERAAAQKAGLMRDLLPAIDNLERALTADGGQDVREGIAMIYQQLLQICKRHEFEPREDVGKEFDPRFHDGVAIGSEPGQAEHVILHVWEKGWMRGTEILRPAKVVVNKPEESKTCAG